MHSRNIAIGGLFTTLSIVVLYLTFLIPTNTLTLLTVTSFVICTTLILSNFYTACITYIATGLLSFFLFPINLSILYILFFGCYGLVKAQVERLDPRFMSIFLKFIFFNTVFTATVLIMEHGLGLVVTQPFRQFCNEFFHALPYGDFILLFIIAQSAFVLFDYALTLLIHLFYGKAPK